MTYFTSGPKKIICSHCGENLGEVREGRDEYDIMKDHINYCTGKIAKDYRKAKDEEEGWGQTKLI